MSQNARGFTIVELLIVIVVIGILAAISIVAFNGVQTRASNTARLQEIRSWEKHFELYKADNGGYPVAANTGFCLGTGFPVGAGGLPRCRDYNSTTSGYTEADSAALMTELQKVGSLPSGTRKPPANTGTVGPYVIYTTNEIYLYAVLEGKDATVCTAGTTLTWTDNVNRAICRILLTR